MQNFRALGAPPPDPRASGGCFPPLGARPQTPIGLWRLGAPPPDPQNIPPPYCEFLAMRQCPPMGLVIGGQVNAKYLLNICKVKIFAVLYLCKNNFV